MTIRELYEFSVERGFALDPRGEGALRMQLGELRSEFDALSSREQRLFDAERLRHPFSDTRVLCGDPATPVRRLVCGINIDGSELLMADRLRDHGRPVDLVVVHHASAHGGAVASRRDVLLAQVKMLTDFGVDERLAVKLIRAGSGGEPQRSMDYRWNQIAEALEMPFMSIHGPADLYLLQESVRVLTEEQPHTAGDLVDICDTWPEVQWMMDRGLGASIAVGHPGDPLGRVYACFYGGWNPTPEVFEALCDAGCGTLWVVDTSETLNEVARRRNVNIVVAPHCPADNFGINKLFDDAMDRFGDFDVVDSGDFVRVDRRKP